MRFAPYALGVAILSIAFAAPLFRLAEAAPLTASFWRLAIAVLILLPFTSGAAVSWTSYTRREWGLITASGVALGAHFGLWVSSLFYTTVAASVSLVTLQAVFVALGGHFLLGDRLSRRAWMGVVIAFGGALVIATGEGGFGGFDRRALIGDALALAGGLGSAAYMLIGRRFRATRGLVEYVTPVYAIAALSLLPAMLIFDQGLWAFDPATFGIFVALAAVPMLGGHTLVNWTLKHMEAHVVATWILLEPLGAALLAWPLLGELPTWQVAIGGALVLFGASQTVAAGGSK